MTDHELQQKRLAAAGIDVGALVVVDLILLLLLGLFFKQVHYILILLVNIGLVLGRDLSGGDGRSLGKKLTHIRVVRGGSAPITPRESIRRNMLFVPGLVLALVPSVLGLVPSLANKVGCMADLMFLVPSFIAFMFSFIAMVWELVLIVNEAGGTRLGDKMAETRVTW
jgi:hypothetical protein